ncbi:MAG: hypothetical protein AAGJ86_02235 [Pseudomonadota bacterium]
MRGKYKENQRVELLSDGARLLTESMREWARSVREQECSCGALRELYGYYGVEAALPIGNELMCYVSVATQQRLALHGQNVETLADDEWLMIRIVRAVERDDPETAYRLCADHFPGSLATTLFRVMGAFVSVAVKHGLSFCGTRRPTLVTVLGDPRTR